MFNWSEFAEQAPHIAEIFVRRHAEAETLCLMATTRSDGFPRISPLEPRIVAPELVRQGSLGVVGLPGLRRDVGRQSAIPARIMNAAICALVTKLSAQNRVFSGGLHPTVIPAWASRSMALSKMCPSSSVNRSGPS